MSEEDAQTILSVAEECVAGVAEAVRVLLGAERERCAKLCEHYAASDFCSIAHEDPRSLASLIRSGEEAERE